MNSCEDSRLTWFINAFVQRFKDTCNKPLNVARC